MGDLDWLIAPNGRTCNGTVRSQPLRPKARRVWHWFPDDKPVTSCGKRLDPAKYNLTRNVDETTCKQCLYVAWVHGAVEDDDPRCVKMKAEHAKRLKVLGWRWPVGGTPHSNPKNRITQETIDLMRARRWARKAGRYGRERTD